MAPHGRSALGKLAGTLPGSRKAYLRWKLQNTPNCVFLWIPKTAGTSLFTWLSENIGMQKANLPQRFMNFPNIGAITFGHVQYQSLLYMKTVSEKYDRSAFKFSVVRNPYDRTVSLYNYLHQQGHFEGEFRRFLDEVRLHRPPTGYYNHRGLSQTNPQADWLIGIDGKILADKIFKSENISEAVSFIADKYSVTGSRELPRANQSQKRVKSADILSGNTEAIEIINEIYARDFDLFGYDKK